MAAKVLKAKLWPDEANPDASVCCTRDARDPYRTTDMSQVEAKCARYRRRSIMWLVFLPIDLSGRHFYLLPSEIVSQFTLYGHIKKGNKPDFHNAADVETARRLYDRFVQKVGDLYKADRVKNGVFQAMMEVELKNDGPVGVDFRSEDGAVGTFSFPSPPFRRRSALTRAI